MDGQIRCRQNKEKTGISKTKTKTKSDADSAEHQIGQDNPYVQQKWQNVEIAKEEAITKRCADRQNEYNMWKTQHRRQKKTTRHTMEFEK